MRARIRVHPRVRDRSSLDALLGSKMEWNWLAPFSFEGDPVLHYGDLEGGSPKLFGTEADTRTRARRLTHAHDTGTRTHTRACTHARTQDRT